MSTNDRNLPPVVEQIVNRSGQQIREVAGQISDAAARASDGLSQGIDRMEVKFSDVGHAIADKTKEYSRKTNKVVSENAWWAMGITASFAFVVGLLVGRRR
jgi:ElaB/YqjD/DUF883 family membrane-anchored ribosome-binding protein